jgi:BRCT domain type II-containing protein
MARIYDIKGKTYHFAGRVNALRKADGIAQLDALGCRAVTEASADMIIKGEGGEKKLERVNARDLTGGDHAGARG